MMSLVNRPEQLSAAARVQRAVFSVSVGATWRMFVLRDRVLGRIVKITPESAPGVRISRHFISSSNRTVDAVLAEPAEPARAALLVCHGIGEVVEHWLAVQNLLAQNGVASLVFDYAGYGRSRGRIDWLHCEEDAVSAFAFLQAHAPGAPISLLGFSMGSGVATAILPRVPATGLFLCSAFTSFRDAARVLGLPRSLSSALPRIWRNTEALPGLSIPVSVVHCDRDRAFPVRMASELCAACGDKGELIIVPDQKHNEAFYRPKMSYWSHVIDRLLKLESRQRGRL